MTTPLEVDALGLRVLIDVDGDLTSEQEAELRSAWTGAICSDEGIPDLTVPFHANSEFDRAMERLTVDVTLTALDALRGRALMFHAAGVASADGRVAAFVGPSGRGKTTLSRALGAHFGYVSDETIAVAPDLSIPAYRKPLSVVREGKPKRQVSAHEAGLKDLPDAVLRLAALLVIERDAELAGPEVTALTLTEALPLLITQMSYLADQTDPLQAIATLANETGGVLLLRYPDASTVPPVMPDVFEHAAVAADWRPVDRAVGYGPFSVDHVRDAIIADGTVVVMADEMLQVLDGIAPTAWLAAAAGQDLEQITDAVVAKHGEPPSGAASALVGAALDELIAAGVLQRR